MESTQSVQAWTVSAVPNYVIIMLMRAMMMLVFCSLVLDIMTHNSTVDGFPWLPLLGTLFKSI